jgi:hypothetical protein
MLCYSNCSVAAPAGCCVLAAWVCASCQNSQAGAACLFDRLDTSQQIHRCLLICLASRVVMQVGCCCPLPSAVVVFIAVCTGFVQHVTAARQVQPGLFDRLDTSQQIHRCLLICLASRVGHAGRMLLSSAICRLLCLCVHRVCATCHCNEQVQPGLFDRLDTSQQMHRCLLVCLNLVQVMQVPCSCLLLSAGCCAVAACTGFVQHVNTGGYRLQGLLHRSTQNNRARNWRVELILCRCCCLRAVLF